MKSGTPLVEKLQWDSEHFGFGVGRVLPTGIGPEEAAECVSHGRQLDLRCLYFLAGGADRETWHHAIAAGFLPIGIRMELELQQRGPGSAESSHGGELASGADLPELLRLSAQAFVESRFFRDPGFPRDRAEELFRIWVSRGVGEEGFFTVLQYEEGAPAGFVTGRILEPGRGRIELLAVAASQRGRGVGGRLLAAAKAEFVRRGLPKVTVVTQGSNLPAQRLYQDAGFRTLGVGIWFHAWL